MVDDLGAEHFQVLVAHFGALPTHSETQPPLQYPGFRIARRASTYLFSRRKEASTRSSTGRVCLLGGHHDILAHERPNSLEKPRAVYCSRRLVGPGRGEEFLHRCRGLRAVQGRKVGGILSGWSGGSVDNPHLGTEAVEHLITHRAYLATYSGPAGRGERPEWKGLHGGVGKAVAYWVSWDGAGVWAVGWEGSSGWDLWAPRRIPEGVLLRVWPWGRGPSAPARAQEVRSVPLTDELAGRTLFRVRLLREEDEGAPAHLAG